MNVPGSGPRVPGDFDSNCVACETPAYTVLGFVGVEWTKLALVVVLDGMVRDPKRRAETLLREGGPNCKPCTAPDGRQVVRVTICRECARRSGRFPEPAFLVASAGIPFVEPPESYVISDWPML